MSVTTANSVVAPGAFSRRLAALLVIVYAVISMIPLAWILLTGGGPGSTTEVASITLKRAAFESWRTGYSSAFAIILFVTVFGLANIYVKALNRVKSR